MGFTDRGVIGDKWSSRLLWLCAFGSAIGFYMVAAEKQMRNRQKMVAEAVNAASEAKDGQ